MLRINIVLDLSILAYFAAKARINFVLPRPGPMLKKM